MKTCSKCGEAKTLDAFNRAPSRKDGLFVWCRLCRASASAAWYATNRDKQKAYHAEWRAANPDKAKARIAAWRAANPDKVKAKNVELAVALKPSYVALCLRLPVAQVTPELLELKREQLTYHRLLKEAKTIIKELK